MREPSESVPVMESACCTGDDVCTPPAATRFHFAMNVSDLEKSVAFYEKLFGLPAAKHHPDYAKFELEEPPLVFSLVPGAPGSGGGLSHLGFPVDSRDDVERAFERLTAAGLEVTRQDGTVCGYARQDKIWVADPDQNYWEIYVVHEDVDPETVRRSHDGIALKGTVPTTAATRRVVWEHRVTDAAIDSIPYSAGTVDEVRLTGSFNAALKEVERDRLVAEVRRVLKPGGEVHLHGLVADQELRGMLPRLPGVAALVKRVPLEEEPVRALERAGFINVVVTKLPEAAVFVEGGVEMREIRIAARKDAAATDTGERRVVIYKGPFAETCDDGGRVYRRGERTDVSALEWSRLTISEVAGQFAFLGGAGCGCACG